MVSEKHYMGQEYALAAQKANCNLVCIKEESRGDSPLLLHSCDTLPRLLSSALGLPARGRYRPATAEPDEGHKNDQMMD